MIGLAPLVIVARKDLPANNADELVKLARSRAATQPLSFGSVGVGSLHHVLGEHMARTIGAEMMHVPYKGGAPLMQDMGGGQVDFAILPLAQQHVALAEQGRVKLLGTLSPRRSALPALAAVPSVNEGELLKGFNFTTWTGYFVKRDTPADVVARLHAALNAAMQDAEVKRGLETQNIEVSAPMTPAEADAMYQAETVRFREISSHVKLADAPLTAPSATYSNGDTPTCIRFLKPSPKAPMNSSRCAAISTAIPNWATRNSAPATWWRNA